MAKANQAQEPSMEEILASIRRIISDDTDGSAKAAPAAKAAAAKPAPEPAPASEHMSEEDLDKLFAQVDETPDPFDAAVVEEADDEVMELSDPVAIAVDEPFDLIEGRLPDEADVAFVDPAPKVDRPADIADDLAFGLIEEPAIEEFEVEEVPPPPPPKPRAARPAPPPPPQEAFDDEDLPEEPLISHAAGASVHAAFGSLTHTILSQNAKTLDDLVKEMLRPMLKAWLDENLPVIVERLVRAEIERVSRGR